MPHAVSLIATIATGMGLALLFGFIAVRLRLPALVGYLLAGIAIGPATPGFVGDLAIAGQLAEIGVMLLMFGVGLHFSLRDLLNVRKIALPGAVVQMMVATSLGMGMALSWGWSLGGALVLGLALSVASTVVLLKALEARGLLDTANGRIAVGWLIVEDLAMVLVLVVLPPLAGLLGGAVPGGITHSPIGWTLIRTLLQVGLFVGLMLVVGRRVFPWILWQVAKTGSRELFTLCVIVAALTIAYGATALFGVSFALGAFFAGMVLRESQFSHRAAEQSLPLRDAFSVLFFISVGMLFDPMVIIERPMQLLGVVSVILVGKSLAAAAVVLLFRYPLNTALTVSASLAQIGEFSFILAGLGMSLGLLDQTGQSLIVAGALISIALNPLVFSLIEPFQAWARRRSSWARQLEARADPLSALPDNTDPQFLKRHIVLVGHGRVGRQLARSLKTEHLAYVVIEHNRERVEALRSAGIAAVFGNASDPSTLIQAHIAQATCLIIATADSVGIAQMMAHARLLNPSVAVVLRLHDESQVKWVANQTETYGYSSEQALAELMMQKVRHLVAKA